MTGRSPVSFRRTPAGLLDLKRLQAYTSYLEGGPSPQVLEQLTINCLTPAQTAFCHRLGLFPKPRRLEFVEYLRRLNEPNRPLIQLETPLDQSIWSLAFYPSGYSLSGWPEYNATGKVLLGHFTNEMIKARWPNLPQRIVDRVTDLYTNQKAMVALGRQHGIDGTVTNLLGLTETLPQDIPALHNRLRILLLPREQDKYEPPDQSAEYAWVMHSIIGTIGHVFGLRRLRQFLDERLFCATLPMTDVLDSEVKSPLVELTGHLGQQPVFRLLHESGRQSANSMFIVGVYDAPMGGARKLGEGFGPSILLAQQRACMDALRKVYLAEEHNYPRPSDHQTDEILLSGT